MEAIIGVQVRRKDTLSREYSSRKCALHLTLFNSSYMQYTKLFECLSVYVVFSIIYFTVSDIKTNNGVSLLLFLL